MSKQDKQRAWLVSEKDCSEFFNHPIDFHNLIMDCLIEKAKFKTNKVIINTFKQVRPKERKRSFFSGKSIEIDLGQL